MQFKTLAILSALGAIGSTQDIDNNDVPSVCRSVCQSTVDITTRCDTQNDDDDSGYLNCVCSASNASSFVPECEACIAANDEADNGKQAHNTPTSAHPHKPRIPQKKHTETKLRVPTHTH